MEQVKMENPEIAMAFFMGKPKNVIQKGITTPPPPIPAMVESAMTTGSTINPANSELNIGKIYLCLQVFLVPQSSKGYVEQSVSTSQYSLLLKNWKAWSRKDTSV